MVDQISNAAAELQSLTARSTATKPRPEHQEKAGASASRPETVTEAIDAKALAAIDASKKDEQGGEEHRDQLKASFREINDVMGHFAKSIRFAVYEQSGETYAQIVNTDTNEVVRTIPSKEALDMMARLSDVLGMLIDEQV